MMSRESEMDVPELGFSQSTFASTQDSFTSPHLTGSGSRKRTYEEEAEEEMDAFFGEVDAEEAMQQLRRPIARMKERSGKAKVELGGPVRVVGVDDFGEAEFLAPMEVDRI